MLKNLFLLIILVAFVYGVSWRYGSNIELLQSGKLSATNEFKIKSKTVSLGINNILLLEYQNGERGAVLFQEMTDNKEVKYKTWHSYPEAPNKFSSNTGIVFQKYWRTRTGKHNYKVTDIGGVYHMPIGESLIEWSASTWVYIPDETKFSIQKNSNDFPNFNNENLEWHISGNSENKPAI